jgi:hypothetical protein
VGFWYYEDEALVAVVEIVQKNGLNVVKLAVADKYNVCTMK